MRTVYFVRHGERDTCVKSELDAPLTTDGHEKVKLLYQLLPLTIEGPIYSSPYLRAIQSITPMARKYGKKICILEGLKEREVGMWVSDFQDFTKKQWQDWSFKLEDGESLLEVKERVMPLFISLFEINTDDFLISGHGTVFSVLFHELTKGSFDYSAFKKMSMPEIYRGVFDDEMNVVNFTKLTHDLT